MSWYGLHPRRWCSLGVRGWWKRCLHQEPHQNRLSPSSWSLLFFFFPNLITSGPPPSTSAHLRLFFYTGNEKNLLSPPRRHTRVTKFRHSQTSSSTPSSLAPSTHVLPFPHPIPISFLSLTALLPPPSLLDSKHLKKKKKKKPRQPQTRY